MSAHTPAPWWPTDHGVRDRGGYIAHMNSVQRYLEQDERYAFEVAQREADKRLIAAAPELLAALQLVRMSAGWHALSAESRQVIDAAISKATGAQS